MNILERFRSLWDGHLREGAPFLQRSRGDSFGLGGQSGARFPHRLNTVTWPHAFEFYEDVGKLFAESASRSWPDWSAASALISAKAQLARGANNNFITWGRFSKQTNNSFDRSIRNAFGLEPFLVISQDVAEIQRSQITAKDVGSVAEMSAYRSRGRKLAGVGPRIRRDESGGLR